jgi:hypothetical protein
MEPFALETIIEFKLGDTNSSTAALMFNYEQEKIAG